MTSSFFSPRRSLLSSRRAPVRSNAFLTAAFAALLLASQIACTPRTPQATTPELTLLYNTEEESAEKSAVAQVVQAQLLKAGIPTKLEPVANSVFYDRIGSGSYQSALALWYLDYDDPEGFLTDFYSKAGFRMAKYQSADYDKAYLTGLLAPAAAGKLAGFQEARRILLKDLPWIPLYSNNEIFLLGQGAEGFQSNAYQYYDYRNVSRESVRAASNVELQTLDPALVYDLASKHVSTQSYEGLVAMDAKLSIVPALASSWEFSAGMDRIVFTLRKGVKFHGAFGAVTSKDVKASFERMLKQNSPYAYIFDHVKGVDEYKAGKTPGVSGFRADAPNSFVIELKEPFPTMLTWLLAPAASIVPSELPQKYDFSKGSVGTGPFILKSWNGSLAVLDANPSYWKKADDGTALPKAKTLSIRIMKEVNATLTAFQHGDLDVLDVPLALYGEVLDTTGRLKPQYARYRMTTVQLNNLKFLSFRMGSAPWGTDAALRRKVYDSIDRTAIVTNLFRGQARAASGLIPQWETKRP